MSIAGGIAAVKASLDVAKIVSDRLTRPDIDVVEVRSKVHEMLIHMVNAQVALGEAQVEICDLHRQLDDSETLKLLEADVEFEQDGHFWVRKSERPTGVIPYCPACWGKDRKLVAMAPYMKPGVVKCPLHETAYTTSVYEEWLAKQPKPERQVRTGWSDRA